MSKVVARSAKQGTVIAEHAPTAKTAQKKTQSAQKKLETALTRSSAKFKPKDASPAPLKDPTAALLHGAPATTNSASKDNRDIAAEPAGPT